ncbi:hypothetical protein GCM10008932_13520 [Alkalibacterium iburiense]|uniref:Flagellar protein FliT n=1 Tax=Alkalibacterium iburiense TaxID=290589 RepID=A0ABN0XEM5_9LACT
MTESLQQQKKRLMEAILERLSQWEKTSEDALETLYLNEEDIKAIKAIDKKLSEDELALFQSENQELLDKVITKQDEFLKELRQQSKQLSTQMKQMNQQKNVVHSYMDKQSSLFIDRDM